jgi:hypothetical protein
MNRWPELIWLARRCYDAESNSQPMTESEVASTLDHPISQRAGQEPERSPEDHIPRVEGSGKNYNRCATREFRMRVPCT